ncbi:hypothetical protein EMCRGX_G025316 [Ephydatia muelleri]
MELPIHSGSEVSVWVQDSTRFIRAVRDLVRNGDFMLNWYQEIRFVAGDEAWLSPQYNRGGTCALSLNVLATRDREDAYYGAVHALGQKFNGRAHWGKYLYWGPENIRQAYEKHDRFAELKKGDGPKEHIHEQVSAETVRLCVVLLLGIEAVYKKSSIEILYNCTILLCLCELGQIIIFLSEYCITK